MMGHITAFESISLDGVVPRLSRPDADRRGRLVGPGDRTDPVVRRSVTTTTGVVIAERDVEGDR